ncbi:MAG: sulfurtransferase TusA family protein [Proteobacteria bacterium]|nr:sulfurtransferase TusA family protein [Pseudomonadota bacterium]
MTCTAENTTCAQDEDGDGYDVFLDITSEVCPLTFVKTKLLIERMETGQVAQVRLNAGEPLSNVPRSVKEHGHEVLSLEEETEGSGVWRLRLRKLS